MSQAPDRPETPSVALLDPIRWVSRSVLNRLTAISLGASAVLLVLAAMIALPLFYRQAQANIAERYANSLNHADEQLRFRVSALVQSLQHLAANSFVVNAFVDSTGRELYLLPTLRDYRPPFESVRSLVLLDSNMTVFGRVGPATPLGQNELQASRAAIGSGRMQLLLDFSQQRPRLLVAVPVFFPPSSAYEGVLLSSVDADSLVDSAIGTLRPTQCLSVALRGETLLPTSCDAREVARWQSIDSTIAPDAMGDTTLTLTFGDTERSALGQLSLAAAAYAGLSALALLLVFVGTRYIGRPFAGKLDELAQTARTLADDPSSTARAQWSHPDEIGRLTRAFDALVQKWRDNQSSLERRVAERTEQLAGALMRAEESSRAKSEFLAVMSHEIRTPMNGVVGMIQALETTDLDAEQRRQLRVIRGSSDLLLRVIDDLLDFAKIEAGRLELDTAPMRVDRVAQDVIATLLPSAQSKGVTLHLAPTPVEASVQVSGDATRLRQALTNLVHNAIKFTGSAGHVDVRLEVSSHPTAPTFVFSVADSGIGIEAEKLERIFEPFEQADRTTTRRFGGTGLGLAIVKRLTGLMGGSVEVHSELGKGSTFVIRLALPVCAADAEAEAEAERLPLAPATFHRLRVLVAEDNPTNQLVAAAQLQSLGIAEVTTANNGREALAEAAQAHFDLILMDIHMPEMDGCEAAMALRRAGSTVPIVAMTANVLPEDRAAYRDAGMVDYLSKPLSLDRLREVIERWHLQQA